MATAKKRERKVPNPSHEFAQFAERCKVLHGHFRGATTDTEYLADDYLQAERYARLLETIQEWAHSEWASDSQHEFVKGFQDAKAHIRSLVARVWRTS
jgi:hypothetical protein